MKEEGRKKIKKENTKVKLMKFQISIFFARRKGKFYFILFYLLFLSLLRTIPKENIISFSSTQSQIQILPDIYRATLLFWNSLYGNGSGATLA